MNQWTHIKLSYTQLSLNIVMINLPSKYKIILYLRLCKALKEQIPPPPKHRPI
jgi:hypothetical protein